jgi:hypothetical protein
MSDSVSDEFRVTREALVGVTALSRRYYEECRASFPALRALVFRNPIEDIIPGISDIDMRFICDEVEPDDWARLSEAVYRVHMRMVQEGPRLWRLLEHPPGACMTAGEVLDSRLFHPEMRQWEWCCGDEALKDRLMEHISESGWSKRDEYYYLKRLLPHYGLGKRPTSP